MSGRTDKKLIEISKKLAWALRHGINTLGIAITPAGYVNLRELLSTPEFHNVTLELVERVVATDSKSRYLLMKENGEVFIRANQGHSIKEVKDEDLLTPLTDPTRYPTIIHGTNKSSWKLIKSRGLYRMNRNHIHFAIGLPGAGEVISGARVNCDVFIYIDIARALNEGLKFFVSQNNVVLSAGINGFISPKYFSRVLVDRVEVPISYSPIEFDYMLVLDFEANCVEQGAMECQEIIEFPVKALNCRTLQVDHVFHHYVRPEVVPVLTEFCTGLTGITQEMVGDQETITQVLDKFHEFLVATNIIATRWVFVTCGDWDLKTCLCKEANYKKIGLQSYFHTWVNIKFLVPKLKGGMMEMMKLFEIEHSGRHHSGIDDVTNICECLKYLISSGVGILFEDIHSDDKGILQSDIRFKPRV